MKQWIYLLLLSLGLINTAIAKPIHLQLLGINDFHGQLSSSKLDKGRPVGGAAVLAAYLKQAQQGHEKETIITLMGDQIGASEAQSGLLRDEPAILFLNSLANADCQSQNRMNPHCNMVGAVGNHEFDRGLPTLLEQLNGSDKPPFQHWIDLDHFPGTSFPMLSANIYDRQSDQLIFPAYAIKEINGVKVGFIGAVLTNAPDSIDPANIKTVRFADDVQSINQQIPAVKAAGADVIVVLIHQGGSQHAYEGDTQENASIDGPIKQVVHDLDDAVDVVMAGHTHQFHNAMLNNQHGKRILVTQAKSYSQAFAKVDLELDEQHHLLSKKAQIITSYADQWPGNQPDQATRTLIDTAEQAVSEQMNAHVAESRSDLLKHFNAAGESNLGDLVADSFVHYAKTDIGIVNATGIRADIPAGEIRWGQIYAALPFGSRVVTLAFTGAQLKQLLEEQWMGEHDSMLEISGMRYTWDASKPLGQRVVALQIHEQPMNPEQTYTVAITSYMAAGGTQFKVIKQTCFIKDGVVDVTAMVDYLKSLPQPIDYRIEGRVQRLG